MIIFEILVYIKHFVLFGQFSRKFLPGFELELLVLRFGGDKKLYVIKVTYFFCLHIFGKKCLKFFVSISYVIYEITNGEFLIDDTCLRVFHIFQSYHPVVLQFIFLDKNAWARFYPSVIEIIKPQRDQKWS